MLGSVPAAQAALNGTLYAVVSPIYDGSNGSTSFLRLYGGVGSAGSTFEISVVRTIDGAVLGTTNIAVPKNASPQFEMHTILAKANVGEVPDHGYAFYLRNPEPTAGYQHVTYNGLSTLFENVNNCAFMLNEVVKTAYPSVVVTNLHTAVPIFTNYPTQVDIHNYWNAPANYGVYVYDAGTADNSGVIRSGSGSMMGSRVYRVGANSSISLSMAQIQQDIGWSATPNVQLHANLIVTEVTNQAPAETVGVVIVTKQLGGSVNMSNTCAVNAPPAPGGGGTIGGGDSGAYLN
jgi:hypothetical protein